MKMQRHLPTTCAVLLAATLSLAACGDDEAGSAPDTTVAATAAPTDAPTTDPADDAAGLLEITMMDFHYDGLPESVPVGTEVAVSNASESELHEFVAFRLPDDELRSADEIMTDDPGSLLGSAEPTMVLLAPPGSAEQIVPVGAPVFDEAGRYLILCAIPTGADPQAYLDAAATSDGPPEVDGGMPHFMNGMYAIVDVTV